MSDTTVTLKRGKKGRNSLFSVIWQGVPFNFVQGCRAYVEASERKLRDVGFFGTSSKSREEIEKFERE